MRLAYRPRALAQPGSPLPINWAHPLAENLAWAMFAGAGLYDPVSGVIGVPSGTTVPTQGPFKAANAQWFSGYNFTGTAYGASYVNFGASAYTANLATQAATWAFLFYVPSGATSFQLVERNDGNTVNAGWAVDSGTTANSLQFNIERATTNTRVNSNGGVIAGQWNTGVITAPGDAVAANVGIYVNGVKFPPNTVAAGSGVQGDDSSQSLYVGRSVYASKSLNGNIAVGMIAKRVWGLAEAESFHVNPFAILTMPRRLARGFTVQSGAAWRFFLG